MKELPKDYALQQVYNDILFLGQHIKAMEVELGEWSEFMTVELLKDHARIHKIKISFSYFKASLKTKWKDVFDRLEDVYRNLHTDKKDSYTINNK